MLQEGAVLSRHFGVEQTSTKPDGTVVSKVRPIDNFTESQINPPALCSHRAAVSKHTQAYARRLCGRCAVKKSGQSILRMSFIPGFQEHGNDFHVVLLQETWYRADMDFLDRGWIYINSGIGEGAARAHAGVMVLLRRAIFDRSHVRFHSVVPERLLQVQALCKGAGSM